MDEADLKPVDADPDADLDSDAGAAPAGPPVPVKRRRRWLRRLLVAGLAVVVLLVAVTGGVGWYFSGQVITVSHDPDHPIEIVAVNGDEITLTRTDETARPIRFGLDWPGGHALLTPAVRTDGNRTVRTVAQLTKGTLAAGTAAVLDGHVLEGDPKQALGLDFSDVPVPSDVGDLPGWLVPATGSTWVIGIHGRGSSRREALRIMPTLHEAGYPVLAISYRNDTGAPTGPDGRYHLGNTEWRDVQAAVTYARSHGARDVILYGWSMGGGMAMTALRRAPDGIRAMILDSPVVDWRSTLDLQGRNRSLPGPWIASAEWFVQQRADLNLDDLDQRRYAKDLRIPVLLYVDTDDTTVPPAPSLDFAHSRPDLVTLVTTHGADHTNSWNADPPTYESALRTFLQHTP